MEIKNVSIVGMGSLGLIFGSFLYDKIGKENVEYIVDKARAEISEYGHRIINGKEYNFNVVSEDDENHKADLIIFAVKSTALEEAIKIVKNRVGQSTLMISLQNGINSEEVISKVYGSGNVLYTIAEGMDPIRDKNTLNFKKMGYLRTGTDTDENGKRERLDILLKFFDSIDFPYIYEEDVKHRLWSKFMLNVGVNQVVMINEGNFDSIQSPGPQRDLVIAAMREVMDLAKEENINLTEEDFKFYLNLVDSLDPNGMPSMRFDGLHKIKSEVDIFAGTVLKLGEKHGIDTPVNKEIYNKIKEIEADY
ncbi:MAG: 2-dehydropantoate 2-reductase [Gudongella sp.]|jgi:2-dehydropantoate 2-reductase|nr:2-dehydropantoate 2-reductase [Gudongella sp.]